MPERLTDAQIDKLLALEAKATPGDWNYDGMHNELTTTHRANGEYWIVVSESRNTPEDKLPATDEFGHYENPNFRLLAASRNSIRSLLEEVRERRAAEKTEWRLVCIDPESTVYSGTVNSEELADIEREKWHGTWKKQYRIAAGPWTDAEPARAEKEGKNR